MKISISTAKFTDMKKFRDFLTDVDNIMDIVETYNNLEVTLETSVDCNKKN